MIDLESALDEAWHVRQAHFPAQITFAYPLDTALISLTGSRCALQCAHCGGRYLQHMRPIEEAQVGGATSALISGGCDRQGRVPVEGALDLIDAIRPGLKMNWHVGLIEEREMQRIAPYVDVISFDMVGDEDTIRAVYGLDRTPDDYVATYEMLRQYVHVVPHITVGLRGGQLGHERAAIERLAGAGLDELVFIVFIPTPGTPYADSPAPEVSQVARLLAETRGKLPSLPIQLGCMRPRDTYRAKLDPLAVRAGVNVVVSPSRQGQAMAERLGLEVVRTRECCVFH